MAKACQILGKLKRTFRYWDSMTFKTLYSAYVRPHLEYCAPVWSPYRRKDISIIEKVQRRATKLVPYLKNLCYNERLIALNLTTLEERRIRGDLIQFFKFFSGSNLITWQKSPSKRVEPTGPAGGIRRDPHCLQRPGITRCDQREHFFIYRVIPHWNALPEEVIKSCSLNQFKNRLDIHLDNQRLTQHEALRLGSIQY